jgi:hypothetical protein
MFLLLEEVKEHPQPLPEVVAEARQVMALEAQEMPADIPFLKEIMVVMEHLMVEDKVAAAVALAALEQRLILVMLVAAEAELQIQ